MMKSSGVISQQKRWLLLQRTEKGPTKGGKWKGKKIFRVTDWIFKIEMISSRTKDWIGFSDNWIIREKQQQRKINLKVDKFKRLDF